MQEDRLAAVRAWVQRVTCREDLPAVLEEKADREAWDLTALVDDAQLDEPGCQGTSGAARGRS
jgi:hypothetical protein